MLEDILQQSRPGVNPQLEEMISKLMMGGAGQEKPGASMPMRQPLPQSALGAPSGGQAGASAQDQANQTYQILIQQGVPPKLAQQAIADPALLQDILRQLQGGGGPQEQPQMMPSGNSRMSPPPPGAGANMTGGPMGKPY